MFTVDFNIVAAGAVDREFWCIQDSFERTLECQGMLWGPHCAPFVSLLGAFLSSLEHLGQSWGTLWDTWVSIETSSGCLGTALEILRPPETPSQAEGSQVPRLRTKIEGGC